MRTPLIAWLAPVFALGLAAGCGDTVKDEAASTTTTSAGDQGEACVTKVVDFLNHELDLDRLAANDPTYETEIVAGLGDCQIADLTDEQRQSVQTQLEPAVAAALGVGATGTSGESPTSSSTP